MATTAEADTPRPRDVSIPKRVSEVLWLVASTVQFQEHLGGFNP